MAPIIFWWIWIPLKNFTEATRVQMEPTPFSAGQTRPAVLIFPLLFLGHEKGGEHSPPFFIK